MATKISTAAWCGICAFAVVLGLPSACSPSRSLAAEDAGAVDAAPDSGARPAPLALDLLFVFQNSLGSAEEQQTVAHGFQRLLAQLAALDGPLSLHVGFISSNLGVGQYDFAFAGCRIGGDQAALQNAPFLGVASSCAANGMLASPSNRFLRWSRTSAGEESNFTGTLDDAFKCYARLSGSGCFLPQDLAALRLALEGCDIEGGCRQPLNEGFLRGEAALAVVIVGEDDDCSAPPDATLFNPADETLGRPVSYRCFEYGVLCDGQPVGREEGPHESCAPGSQDPDPRHKLIPVGEVAAFLKGLKSDPRRVYVAAIAGPPEPVLVGADSNGPRVQKSCQGEVGAGWPGIRIDAFLREFDPDRGRFFPMCASVPDFESNVEQNRRRPRRPGRRGLGARRA